MDPKQVLPDVLPGKANIMPNPFASKMSGGADTRPEPLRYGFGGESVMPGKAIFMGGNRKKRGTKRRRQHNKKQSQRKKQRR